MTELSGMEGQEAQLQGVTLAGSRDRKTACKRVKFLLVIRNSLCIALETTPECQHSGAKPQGSLLGSRAWLGDGPTARLKCPMQLPKRLVLVKVYTKNLLVMHLCRIHVELSTAGGLCPKHFPLYCEHKTCLIHLERYLT